MPEERTSSLIGCDVTVKSRLEATELRSENRLFDLSRLVDLSLREAEHGFERPRRVCWIIERP